MLSINCASNLVLTGSHGVACESMRLEFSEDQIPKIMEQMLDLDF